MRRYTTITYSRNPSQAKVRRALSAAPVAVPAPPVETRTITGEIRLDGTPLAGAVVSFAGDGLATSNASGTYTGTLVVGYSGVASLLTYTPPPFFVTPSTRVYSSLGTNQYGQDYDIESQIFEIAGVITSNGTGLSIPLSNGTTTWSSDASGSYAFYVLGGWSGTTTPSYISSPTNYVYVTVLADFNTQDFDIPIPPLTYTPTDLAWLGWAYQNPNQWKIEVSATGTSAWTFYNYTAGSNATYNVAASVGSFFRITGVNSGSNAITPISNVVHAEPPDPGVWTISGALTEAGTAMVGIGVEFTGYGTTITNGSGTYSQGVVGGFSGTVIPHYSGGSFVPQYRTYASVFSNQLNQDYVFYGTGTSVPPVDCPVPSTLQTIPLPLPNGASRNVIDPVNNLLWVIDDNFTYVYYADVVAGTFAGSVDVNSVSGSPCIAYDPINEKIVVLTYDGSLAFINPLTKAVTYANQTVRSPGFHMLTVDEMTGTIYASSQRNVTNGSIYVFSGNTEQLLASVKQVVSTDSICWAENISQLVVNSIGIGTTRFYLFNPATSNFAASAAVSPQNFNYENYYVSALGHVIISDSGLQASDVFNISAGTDAAIIATIPTKRLNDVTVDTCTNRLFINDGAFGVDEYSLDGSYTHINQWNNNQAGFVSTGLAHSRATNLVYYEDFNDGTIYTLHATLASGSVGGMIWSLTDNLPQTGVFGTQSYAGGDGTFNGSSTGDDVNGFAQWHPVANGQLSNLGTPYAAAITINYTGSHWDTGNVDLSSNTDITVNMNGVSDNVSISTSGSFGGLLAVAGTVVTGYNTFFTSIYNTGGASFSGPPAYFFTQASGSVTVRPLTHP